MTALSHKIRLDPNPTQAKALARACGVARFTWNWALAEWNRQYEAGEKPNTMALKKQWNAIKREQFPWVLESPSDANLQPFADLQRAFTNFFAGRARRPRFKKRGQHDSFYIANARFDVDGRSVRLGPLGWFRMREELRFNGKILSARVSREADQWFIAIQVELAEALPQTVGEGTVGVDLGIAHLATMSNGEVVDAPKPLAQKLTKLRRLQRSVSRKQRGSRNREKAKRKVARLHLRIRNIRNDCLHRLTTKLCRENQAVVIEDLNVAGMVHNRHLARAIADVGMGEFRRQLTYKADLYGVALLVADRWYPSSKTCSACGAVTPHLALSERTFVCAECGAVMDRDLNAARNLEGLGTPKPGGIACGPEGSGEVATLRETSRDEAGTRRVHGADDGR